MLGRHPRIFVCMLQEVNKIKVKGTIVFNDSIKDNRPLMAAYKLFTAGFQRGFLDEFEGLAAIFAVKIPVLKMAFYEIAKGR